MKRRCVAKKTNSLKEMPTLLTRVILPITPSGNPYWGALHVMPPPDSKSAYCGCLAYPLEGAAVGECRYNAEALQDANGVCDICAHRLRLKYVRLLTILHFVDEPVPLAA